MTVNGQWTYMVIVRRIVRGRVLRSASHSRQDRRGDRINGGGMGCGIVANYTVEVIH